MTGKSVFVILLFLLWCVFSTWYYNCKIKGLCGDTISTTQEIEKQDNEVMQEAMKADSLQKPTNIPVYNGIRFLWNSDSSQVVNISSYLQENIIGNLGSEEKVLITGKYFTTENYSGEYENLGFARARDVKKYLEEFIGEDRMEFSSEIEENDSSLTETMNLVSFKTILPEKELEVAKRDGKVLIYFDSNSDNPIFGDGVIRFLDEIAQTLLNDKYKSIRATGYTDEIGNPKNNYYMGLHRATAVKDYLVSKGCNPNQIELKSYGEYRPVAENSTEEGRAKNRRVEIKLNY